MTVADLLHRLTALAGTSSPWDVSGIRKEILAEHDRAVTTRDREALLSIHKAIMDSAERQIRPEDLAEFKKLRSQDYNLLLIKEALIGDDSGYINPQRMGAITHREVAAGRMSPDDKLHRLADAGAALLTPRPEPPPKTSFLARLFARGG